MNKLTANKALIWAVLAGLLTASAGMEPNRPPSDGLQFFGTFTVSARDRSAAVALQDTAGRTLYRVELPPAG